MLTSMKWFVTFIFLVGALALATDQSGADAAKPVMPKALRGDWCWVNKTTARRCNDADRSTNEGITITRTGFDTGHEYGCTLISRWSGVTGGDYLFKCSSGEGSPLGVDISVWYERYWVHFNADGFLIWKAREFKDEYYPQVN